LKQAKNKQSKFDVTSQVRRHIVEGIFIGLAAIAIFVLLSLVSYAPSDPGWSNTGDIGTATQNAGGAIGAWLADFMLYCFGYIAYLFPIGFVYGGWLVFRQRNDSDAHERNYWVLALRSFGFLLLLCGACGLFSLHVNASPSYLPYSAGGILGQLIGPGLTGALNFTGTSLILIAFVLAGVTLATGMSWFTVTDHVGHYTIIAAVWVKDRAVDFYYWVLDKWLERREAKAERAEQAPKPKRKPTPLIAVPAPQPVQAAVSERKPIIAEPQVNMIQPSVRAQKERQGKLFESPEFASLPPLSLLERAKESKDPAFSKEVLQNLSSLLESKLKEFGVQANVVAVYPGPVITRFELDLAAGTKASRLTSLSRDLARSLSVISVRIVEVIAGKSYVGLEIPNENREIVRLSEVLESQEFEASKSALSLALGKDIAGHPVVVDLGKMPHLLVAGTTGSGKSVGVNAMLLSLLYKGTPDEVRLILIDPKMLELSIYDDIPHLLTPVITDMKDAANSLRWAIGEMDRRYKVMAALGVRNLAGYNTKVKEAKKPIPDPAWPKVAEGEAPELEVLPSIVIVVDEFADMMMVVGKKVEELIARLAQKARAAGIHLILATQRPSVDVITGLIKANIPTRIAFQVSSRIDSRTILDQAGAEQLLGHGDMLYMPTGKEPTRVHGAFVADQEVHNVVHDLKERGSPSYLDEVLEGNKNISDTGVPISGGEGGDDLDALFDDAVKIVAETRRASISSVQRRLKIGYNRAARILEEMEAQGMVTPMESNGAREVLIPAPAE
tara:strand:- start:4220 stop:6574 length:2355 start_codon:yes stop_codon:yes gene_type:complete